MIRLYPVLETDQEKANYLKYKKRLIEIDTIIRTLGSDKLEWPVVRKEAGGFWVASLRNCLRVLDYRIKFHPDHPNQFIILSGREGVTDQKTSDAIQPASRPTNEIGLSLPKRTMDSMIQEIASKRFEFQLLREDFDLDGFILANLRTCHDLLDYSVKFHPEHPNEFIIISRKTSEPFSHASHASDTSDDPYHPKLTIDTDVQNSG